MKKQWIWVSSLGDSGAMLMDGDPESGEVVLAAARHGAQNATLVFNHDQVLHRAEELEPVKAKRAYNVGLKHSDAMLIAAAPDLFYACKNTILHLLSKSQLTDEEINLVEQLRKALHEAGQDSDPLFLANLI